MGQGQGSTPEESKQDLPPELKTCTVMACSVLHLDELIGEIAQERMALHRLIVALPQILKAFSDLYLELTDESERRRFLDQSILRAEREAQRLRLPLWFWRSEEELHLKEQVYRRARFLLFERKASVDDTFDLLREYCDEYVSPETPATDAQLAAIIEFAFKKGVN